jgi:hypothetical protein
MSIIADDAKAAGRTRHSLPVFPRPCSEKPADCKCSVRTDKGLVVKVANGAANLKERLEVARSTPEQVRESELRNQIGWIAWADGNDRFWDFAAFDLLKTVSTYIGVVCGRQAAFYDGGLIDTLVGLSKCPDYVVNCGRYLSANLSLDDKEALIGRVKRF